MKRVNGKMASKENASKFEKFIAERERLNDWNDYVDPTRTRLLRGKIVEICGFARSVLLQNPTVAGRLSRMEKELRERKILVENDDGESRNDLVREGEADRDSWVTSLEEQLDVVEAAIHEIRESVLNIERRVDEIISC